MMKAAPAGPETRGSFTRLLSRNSQQGGSLVEAVMAVAILAMMGAAIIGSINYGIFMTRLARENARATQVMLEKLETIRLYNWSEVSTPGFVPSQFTDVYDPQAPTNQQGTIYTGSIIISNAPLGTSYATNVKEFTVTLSWVSAGQIPHTRSISTLVARDGLQSYVY